MRKFGDPQRFKMEDPRLQDSRYCSRLQDMARESGWSERGGCIIRAYDVRTNTNDGDVVGRTRWIPIQPWFKFLQQDAGIYPNFGGEATKAAVKRALAGELMKPTEIRHVTWMLDEITQDNEVATDALLDSGWGVPTWQDAESVALVTRVSALNPELVERLAVRHENDDATFIQGLQRFLDAIDDQIPNAYCGIESGSVSEAAPSRPRTSATLN